MDFYELVDNARVKLVLNADNLPFEEPECVDNCKKSLGMYLKRKTNKDHKRKIHYLQKNNYGRYYAVGGIGCQSLKHEIRNYLLGDTYHELDISNCAPTIINKLLQDYDKNGYSTLQEYVSNREAFLEENHIDKEDFTIDYLASEMNIGRNKVYSKIKGITGMTPNDFIQNIKLKKAAHCLKNNPELTIGEVAYKFGFGTPQYFSKCFKKSFGITPLDYRREGKLTD
jgi:AraC-like DNA-binding protein